MEVIKKSGCMKRTKRKEDVRNPPTILITEIQDKRKIIFVNYHFYRENRGEIDIKWLQLHYI